MDERIRNRLRETRTARGWSQGQVAEQVGISRQSYSAIENAGAVPGTDIALRLARLFGAGVEELFILSGAVGERLVARWAPGSLEQQASEESARGTATPYPGRMIGQRVRLGRVGGVLLAMDVADAFHPLSAADGIVMRPVDAEGSVEISLVQRRPPAPDLVVAGCDPAFPLVADTLRRDHGIEVHYRQMGSRSALEALARGECHVAGSHLPPPHSPAEVDWIENVVPFPCTRVGCAVWEQGLLVKEGNPLGIGGVADLARREVRFLNRERGSGSRILLDERLAYAGIPTDSVSGYASAARGHLAVAEAIASDLVDAGVAIRAAGRSFGLDVIPLVQERYELVIPNHFLDLPAIDVMLKLLRRGSVRDQFEVLDGYDCTSMGEIL